MAFLYWILIQFQNMLMGLIIRGIIYFNDINEQKQI